jgi:antitoxin MazE
MGGDNSAIYIPASVMALAGLRPDQTVDTWAERGKILIEPVMAPKYDLDQMLERMTPDTFPDQLDFGPPQGHEEW